MSIQSEITLLQNTKGEIRNAIMEKGVTVTSSDLFSTYPTRISQISMTPGDKDALFRSLIERTATSLVIPEGTEVIRYGAFNHYETLTSVTIPNTVTTICHGAFGGTKGITSIVIPNSVTTIEETAFSSSGLTSVTLPSSVTSIEGYTFSNCTSLASVTIPNSVTIIKQYAFENCTSLTSVNIPDSVASINRYAFTGCSNLASITFNSTTPPTLASHALDKSNNCPIYVPEDSVDTYKTTWPDYASRIQAIVVESFAMKFTPAGGGTPIEVELEDLATAGTIASTDVPSTIKNGTGTLEIGDGVVTIGTEAFRDCTGLTSVTIPSGVTSIGYSAFRYCSALTSVTIPNSVTSIGVYSFYQCYSLTSVSIPDSVTSIGEGAFFSCTGLTSVTIPNSVTSIGTNAIRNCTSLTSIDIPNSVTIIKGNAFYGCTGLNYITVNSTTPPSMAVGAFDNTNACPLIVPVSSVDAYKTAWSAYADRIVGEGVAYWKLLGGTCNTNESGYNTGYITNRYEDTNPTSPTYGNTRTETVQDEVTCPTQVWKLIGSICETDENDKNTGYVINTYEDVNPSSSTYGQTRTETVRDKITCPTPVGTGFTKITSLDDVTSGKYLIVDTATNKALDASLIASTKSSSTGINSSGNNNCIDVTIDNDTIEATETTLNAAVDYDADNHTLSWTDTENEKLYFIQWKSGASYAYGADRFKQLNNTIPKIVYDSITFNTSSSPTRSIGKHDSYDLIKFYSENNSTYYTSIALFKLDE